MNDSDIWLRIGHIVGFVLWISGMLSTLYLLRVHAMVEGPARDVVARQEGRTAMIMDLGATLAITCGFVTAFTRVPSSFKTGGWLHIKLTIIALTLFAIHGFTRAQVKRYRNGQIKPLPRALPYVVMAAATVVIILGAHPTLLRK
ncbi:MAG: CopD family protein [Myxococcales bacterium]|nr:CopD family protein [Myxococcales bacterium]